MTVRLFALGSASQLQLRPFSLERYTPLSLNPFHRLYADKRVDLVRLFLLESVEEESIVSRNSIASPGRDVPGRCCETSRDLLRSSNRSISCRSLDTCQSPRETCALNRFAYLSPVDVARRGIFHRAREPRSRRKRF